MAIRTPKCCHFGRSASKTVRFWGTDCHGATPLAMTVLFQIAFFDSLKCRAKWLCIFYSNTIETTAAARQIRSHSQMGDRTMPTARTQRRGLRIRGKNRRMPR